MTVKPGWARKRDRLRRRGADTVSAGPAGPLWAFSPAEWRTLAITFVGGVGSLVAAAAIIGGAIAIVRAFLPNHRQGHWGHFAVATAVVLPLGALVIWGLWRDSKLPKAFRWVMSVLVGLMSALYLLVWVGVAAGIH